MKDARKVDARRDYAKERSLFMLRVMRGKVSAKQIETHLVIPIERLNLEKLLKAAVWEPSFVRRRAQAVIFCHCGISVVAIMRVLILGRNTIKRYRRKFEAGGVEALLERKCWGKGRKGDSSELRKEILSILHAPPLTFGFNRTSWTIALLKRALLSRGHLVGKNNVSKIVKNAGFKFWKAKEILTSNDPSYREKVAAITEILSHLDANERFFSIDEFGPFAVKERGGRRLVPKTEFPTVPQFQRSKGTLIVTAALELSTNQVTHFYSKRKDSEEILKMLNVLIEKYKGCHTLYLSWDDASWHSSKRLCAEITRVNDELRRITPEIPAIRIAPLPARSQFLNVIESVFSGLSAAVIENSNYESVDAAKVAIDRHFSERNDHFLEHPKKAGNKIWGKEQVPSAFEAGQNCKDPSWR